MNIYAVDASSSTWSHNQKKLKHRWCGGKCQRWRQQMFCVGKTARYEGLKFTEAGTWIKEHASTSHEEGQGPTNHLNKPGDKQWNKLVLLIRVMPTLLELKFLLTRVWMYTRGWVACWQNDLSIAVMLESELNSFSFSIFHFWSNVICPQMEVLDRISKYCTQWTFI